MLFLLRYMASGRAGLTFKFVPLQGRLFLDILKVGIPTAVNTVLTNLTVILVTAAVGLFGTTALAAYGVASRLDYVMIPILFGLCTAVLTMVGVNIGAGQIARARKIAWTSSLVGLVLTGSIGLVVAIFPLLWLHLFSHDADVLRQGTTYLRIVTPAYAALGFGFVVAFASAGRRPRAVAVRRLGYPDPGRGRPGLDRGRLFRRRDGGAGVDGGSVAGGLRSDLRHRDALAPGLVAGQDLSYRARSGASGTRVSAAVIGLLQRRDVELDHLHHRLHRAAARRHDRSHRGISSSPTARSARTRRNGP